MYASGFAILGAQFLFGDPFGINLQSYTGSDIKSNLNSIININNINTQQLNVTQTPRSSVVNNPVTTAASVLWELLLLLTGTYIFNIMYILGIPAIIIAGMVVLYFILLMRTIIGYLRGI